jgi:hypothetical protein
LNSLPLLLLLLIMLCSNLWRTMKVNRKVIKINLTTALNSEILRFLVQWFPNGGLGFCRSGNPTISSQMHNAFY